METFAVVFWFLNKMAERFPEIELEEIQELKENAEKKNTKRKHKKYICSRGEGAFTTRARLREATKCSITSLSHLLILLPEDEKWTKIFHEE